MFIYRKKDHPHLLTDVAINGKQACCSDELTEQQQKEVEKIYKSNKIVEGKLKIPSCIDTKALPYRVRGKLQLHNFVLENTDVSGEYIINVSGKNFTSCSVVNYIKYYC
jgi:hypothetical protein